MITISPETKAAFYSDLRRRPDKARPDLALATADFSVPDEQKPALVGSLIARQWAAVPTELRAARRWVGFGWVWKTDKKRKNQQHWTKVPRSLKVEAGQGRFRRWNHESAGLNLSTALYAASHQALRWPDGVNGRAPVHGLGFVLGGGFIGVDMDNVRDPESGEFLPWAGEVVRAATDAGGYVDISPSGTGVKLIGRGTWAGRHKGRHPRGGEVEVYDSGRAFLLTGRTVGGTGMPILAPTLDAVSPYLKAIKPRSAVVTRVAGANPTNLTDDDLLAKARSAKNGESFSALWDRTSNGNGSDNSASGGDLALCNRLAFWLNADAARIDAAFRRSMRMRDKWDKPHRADGTTYGSITVATAVAGCTEVYEPMGGETGIPEAPAHLPETPEPEQQTKTPSPKDYCAYTRYTDSSQDDSSDLLAADFLTDTAAGTRPGLIYTAGMFYCWRNNHWKAYTEKDIDPLVNSSIVKSINTRFEVKLKAYSDIPPDKRDPDKAPKKPKMSNTHTSNTIGVLRGHRHVYAENLEPPMWLPDGPTWRAECDGYGLKPVELVPMANGIVHLPAYAEALSKKLAGGFLPHSPHFFALQCGQFNADPHAPVPDEWFNFLHSLWRSDDENILQLQEWLGYLLVPDNSQQKYLSLQGPPRSGKGTILEIIKHLVGDNAYLPIEAEDFASSFGRENMPGMFVTAITECELGKMDRNLAAIQQHIKMRTGSYSGEINLNSKNVKHRKVRLVNRIVIAHNQDLPFKDQSGAMASRKCLIRMLNSFVGKEDKRLIDRLRPELPGIFNWAVLGWLRLQFQGGFTTPRVSSEAAYRDQLKINPAIPFLNEWCVVGPGHAVAKKMAIRAFKYFCLQKGIKPPGNLLALLRSTGLLADPLEGQVRKNGLRPGCYLGFDLALHCPAIPSDDEPTLPHEQSEHESASATVRE